MTEKKKVQWLPTGWTVAPAATTPEGLGSRPSVAVALRRAVGGNLCLATHEGVLYIAPVSPGAVVTDADRDVAQALGYWGPLPIYAPV
ncbi:hypothetical protein [Deinococcus hopiensis]|nr:hypothetical protein [Deinococcus hopiensis]